MTPEQQLSFTNFVERHGDGLLRHARHLFAGPHDAEDGLQTALLRVARNWDTASVSPVAYTRTVLRNLAVDGSRRRHLVPTPSDAEPQVAHAPDIAEAHAAASALDAALGALPPRQRITVVLRAIDGLSEAETAAQLDCSPGTVKSNLSRGLATLRAHLDRAQERTVR